MPGIHLPDGKSDCRLVFSGGATPISERLQHRSQTFPLFNELVFKSRCVITVNRCVRSNRALPCLSGGRITYSEQPLRDSLKSWNLLVVPAETSPLAVKLSSARR